MVFIEEVKAVFRACNVLPFRYTHLALWRQDKRPKVHAKQKGFKNFFSTIYYSNLKYILTLDRKIIKLHGACINYTLNYEDGLIRTSVTSLTMSSFC